MLEDDAHEEAVVVRVEGEVDASNAEELASCLTAALKSASRHSARLLVVDLQNITFFGSAGLTALLDCREQGTTNGTAVRVVASRPEVTRTFEVTQLDKVIGLYPSLTEATAPETLP